MLKKGEFIVNSHGIEDDNGTVYCIMAVSNMGTVFKYLIDSDSWYRRSSI